MKKQTLVWFVILVCLVALSCNNSANKTDSSDSSTTLNRDRPADTSTNMPADTSNHRMDSTGVKNDTARGTSSNKPLNKKTTDFIVKATQGGMMEVQMGQLAQQNASNERVKNFGAMMVQDHSTANKDLEGLAGATNMSVPTALTKEAEHHMKDLASKKGKDFDKAYMKMMLDDHKKDIAEFKKAASSLPDEQFKNFAAKTLPTLQKHLDSAIAISKMKM